MYRNSFLCTVIKNQFGIVNKRQQTKRQTSNTNKEAGLPLDPKYSSFSTISCWKPYAGSQALDPGGSGQSDRRSSFIMIVVHKHFTTLHKREASSHRNTNMHSTSTGMIFHRSSFRALTVDLQKRNEHTSATLRGGRLTDWVFFRLNENEAGAGGNETCASAALDAVHSNFNFSCEKPVKWEYFSRDVYNTQFLISDTIYW